MENEPLNMIQKEQSYVPNMGNPEIVKFPEISFIPPALLKNNTNTETHGIYEKCAFVGVLLGTLAVISWVVILFGVLYSIIGITLSIIGLNSIYKKYAQIGLGLSILGLIFSILYLFAISQGIINFNYFTGDFWSTSPNVEKIAK